MILTLICCMLLLLETATHIVPHAIFNDATNGSTLIFGADTNQDQFSRLSIWESFRNKRIVFLGDSVLRYQYQDLAFFLTSRHWPEPYDRLCNERHFGSWTRYFEYGSHIMRGHELSETYRYEHACCGGWSVCDNRQLYVPELNATLWYFLWYGVQSSPHGHFNLAEGLRNPPCKPGYCSESVSNSSWMLSPSEFTRQFVTFHNPDLFFLNCGLHAYPFDEDYQWGIEQAQTFQQMLNDLKRLPNITTRVIWRSTTPRHKYENGVLVGNLAATRESVAAAMANNGSWELHNISSLVWDLARTQRAHRNISDPDGKISFIWDGTHYHCWVYSEMNRELAVRYLYDGSSTFARVGKSDKANNNASLRPPRTKIEFDSVCRSMNNQPDLLAGYLKIFDHDTFQNVVRDSTSRECLSSIFTAWNRMPSVDARLTSMRAFSKIRGFRSMLSVLSDRDLKAIRLALDDALNRSSDKRKVKAVRALYDL